MGEEKLKEVPKVLEERLLIDDDDRVLLKAVESLSPKDTGNIYVTPTIFESAVPTFKQISDKVGKPVSQVKKQIEKIAQIWKIPSPENLPKNNGIFDDDEALVSAVVNQHKLRWDSNFGDYRVPKIHIMMGEMGTGTLYTNEEAFMGERILRQSMNINEMLSSYVIQGGLMPEFIRMFGKAKNQRALLTGLDKSEGLGQNGKEEKLAEIKQILALGGFKLGKKDYKNLEENVIDTVSSNEEAARSVAHQVAPLFKDIPEDRPIHYQWSYNDWANMNETLDTLLPKLREIHAEMAEATENLPIWREDLEKLKLEISENLVGKLIGERVYYHVNTRKAKFKEGEFPERGDSYKALQLSFFENKKKVKTKMFKSLKEKVKEEFEGITGKKIKGDKLKEEQFDGIFYENVNKFYDTLTTFNRLKEFYESGQKKFNSTATKINSLEDKIHDAERFENSLSVQDETPSWFTKKIAISPAEAKAFWMITKQINKGYYDLLFSEIKRINGKNHKFFQHSDDIINLEIPDPQHSIEGKEDYKNRPVGTTILMMPRTNSQKSNEPILNSFSELQGFHEGEISEGVKKKKVKPKTKGEHDKRDFAFPDIALTSYGADGYNMQEKMTVDQSTIQGDYAKTPLITTYIKVPTRHDVEKLGTLMIKGNKGTWPGKRIVKGGPTTGMVVYIQHPDQSNESIFIDDTYLKTIGKKYGEKYSKLESDLKTFGIEGKSKELEETKVEMNKILEEVKPEVYKVFLQNDMHLGSYSAVGRTSGVDGIRASQLVALQTSGWDNIKYSIMTEALHGEQAFRSHDSKREASTNDFLTISNDSVGFMKRLKMLEHKMRQNGANDKQILEATQLYTREFEEGQPKFKPEDQKATFMEVLYDVNLEMMENKIPLFIGAGNHWMQKKDNEDEANVIATMYDRKYSEQKLLRRGQGASGQGFTYELIELPGKNGTINAIATHKMWHGREEISLLPTQASSTREGATYGFTGDRHHYGAIAERGKMFILDVGKQSTIPYRKMIGKAASVRGTIIGGYGGNDELILSTRSYLDPVVDVVSGWDYKMGILSRSKSLIEEATNDDSVYREMKKMNFLFGKNKEKFSKLEAKLKK